MNSLEEIDESDDDIPCSIEEVNDADNEEVKEEKVLEIGTPEEKDEDDKNETQIVSMASQEKVTEEEITTPACQEEEVQTKKRPRKIVDMLPPKVFLQIDE